jgi:hypothetical protein
MKARLAAVLCVSLVAAASGQDRASAAPTDTKVTPGELVVDPPTLINLGFEWLIDGDANRNASVEVSFRRQGEASWRRGMPLLRLQGETISQPNSWHLVSPNMFAGSILDLQPDTAYEARFVLTDPDGVAGEPANATRTVTVRTRPEPVAYTGGRVYHVYPPSHTGAKAEPSFEGIMCAYYYVCGGGDTTTTARPRVRPGDTILVHAGTYAYRPEFYGPDRTLNVTSPYEGTYYLTASGTPDRPIAIKGAGDGEVIIDGRGNFALFNVQAAHHNYFEGLTFRNTDIAIWAGRQFIAGARGLTVKRCRFEDVGMGVFSNFSGSNNFYIADSTFMGRDDSTRLLGWNGDFWRQVAKAAGQEFPPKMSSYVAVKIYGPGHVVAHNYIANFHDGIDVETYGNPDGSSAIDGPAYPGREFWDRRPVAIDFYNNYLTNFHDNAIEIDGSMHNIRVMRNLMLNSASHPMCNQPAAGGPVYWIRNIAYHAPGGSTRLTSGSAGVLFYNNTIVTETVAGSSANVHWRNNLMLGQNAAPAIFNVTTNTGYSSSDHNGFRPNPGAPASFHWNSPAAPNGVGDGTRESLQTRQFTTLADYARATGQDQHSVTVDYDVFAAVPKLDARDLATVQRLYDGKSLDFRLRPGSAAVDRGVALPGITEGFAGAAPDLGALEVGQPLPVYGPRPLTP